VRNLALVADRQGTVVAAMRDSGTQEVNANFFSRDPYGQLQGASGSGGTLNPEAGFAGASTPNASGGFVYLRNRWYDPQTGRFLTQDPIGLAGGVNLYSYAGNDPVNFDDPFGLEPDCSNPKTLYEAMYCVGVRTQPLREVVDVVGAAELTLVAIPIVGAAAPAAMGIGSAAARGLGFVERRMVNLMTHLTRRDLRAAAAELRGVKTGWDHLKEVRQAMRGMQNVVRRIQRLLSRDLSPAQRARAEEALRRAEDALNRAESALKQ
jgi:RHS repeat-associated protein